MLNLTLWWCFNVDKRSILVDPFLDAQIVQMFTKVNCFIIAAVVACMMLTKQIKTNVTPGVSNGLFLLSAG